MNSSWRDRFLTNREAPFWQDKKALTRFSAASERGSTAVKTALNDPTGLNFQSLPHNTSLLPEKGDLAQQTSKRKHSTKRQKVFAGSWVNRDTDAYIERRLASGRKLDKTLSRSAVIRMMLEERALDDTFQQTQAILLPVIRETIRSEFRVFENTFENRFIRLIAKIAYQVGWILVLLTKFIRIILQKDVKQKHTIEDESETAARVNVTRRNPQDDEVIATVKQYIEEKRV